MEILNIKILGEKWKRKMYMLGNYYDPRQEDFVFILYLINMDDDKIQVIGATKTQNENLLKLNYEYCVQLWENIKVCRHIHLPVHGTDFSSMVDREIFNLV